MAKVCSTQAENRIAYRALVWKPESKREIGGPNGKIILKYVAHNRNQWQAALHTGLNSRKDGEGFDWLSDC